MSTWQVTRLPRNELKVSGSVVCDVIREVVVSFFVTELF